MIADLVRDAFGPRSASGGASVVGDIASRSRRRRCDPAGVTAWTIELDQTAVAVTVQGPDGRSDQHETRPGAQSLGPGLPSRKCPRANQPRPLRLIHSAVRGDDGQNSGCAVMVQAREPRPGFGGLRGHELERGKGGLARQPSTESPAHWATLVVEHGESRCTPPVPIELRGSQLEALHSLAQRAFFGTQDPGGGAVGASHCGGRGPSITGV